ncbi:MAG: helix-turn-helix domain-containing protein [Paludibacteraceae bacterium]
MALQIGFLLLVTIAITIQSTRIRYHRKQRQQTLSAYLDLQERYLAINNRPSVVNEKQPEPQPSLEIIAPGYTSENEKFLNALRQFMEQNIGNAEMTIDDLANVTHMSRSSLNRKMHELFNLSAKDFVQTARIKHACELLRATDMAAKEVAYACGFSDPRYFSKSFKASTGSTPTEYRNNGKDKNKDKG